MANPYFNATYYLTNNPDVFAAGINTVEGAWNHYVNHGAAESLAGATARQPAPWFDASYYLTNNPDLSTAGLTAGQLFEHFTTYGISEGRAPSSVAVLDEANLLAYAKGNDDLLKAFGIEAGATELTDAQEAALAGHFYQFGYKEGRAAAPFTVEAQGGKDGGTFTLTGLTDYADTVGYSINNGTFITNGFKFSSNDQTIAATQATLNNADVLIDNSTKDEDKLNLTLSGALAAGITPTLANIETLNINAAYGAALAVAGTSLNLTNVTGLKTINVSGTSTGANNIVLSNLDLTGVSVIDASGLAGSNLGVTVGAANVANAVTVTGSAANDTINGARAASVINAGAGNDTVNGGNGNDTIDGGEGNDSINGGAGADVLNGGAGSDTIDGGAGNDTIDGGAGNDRLLGDAGNDVINGAEGNDTILGGAGNDTIDGGEGNDVITGGAGADVLTGGAGNDSFVIGAVTDSAASVDANTTVSFDVITDFNTVGTDSINIAAVNGTLTGGAAGNAVVVTTLTTGAASLNTTTIADFAGLKGAVDTLGLTASAAGANIQAYVIDLAGNTGALGTGKYLLINNNDTAMTAADVLIQLTGSSVDPVAADFVIA